MFTTQQFLAAVTQADIEAAVGGRIVIALEQWRGLNHGRQQFGYYRLFELRITQHGTCGNACAHADHQRRAWLAIVDQ
ncbi:hypothetical protein D3C80_1757760 [compost metagenome]